MTSALELQDLYSEVFVRETISKTNACGITWSHLGGNQFQATQVDTSVDPNVTYDFFITKTQTGNTTFKYTFDTKKDAVSLISVVNGPLSYTDRDSLVKELYEIVEMTVLEMDSKLKETIRFVQQIPDCRT